MEKKKGKPSDNSFVVYLTPDIEKRLRKAIYLEKEKLIDKGRSPNEISKSGVAAEQIEKWLKDHNY
jgi:hypothetical protein